MVQLEVTLGTRSLLPFQIRLLILLTNTSLAVVLYVKCYKLCISYAILENNILYAAYFIYH
jgi:hypothetical protein